MTQLAKGAGLEELARAYFARQGFVAIRSVAIQFEDEDVTDVDVWLYGRQGGATRTRALVDVKDKKSPKAFERIIWARGMQLALGCDRSIVTTTDTNATVTRFAQQQKVILLTSTFLKDWIGSDNVLQDRLSLEEFFLNIQCYREHKQDGDWIRQIGVAKSAVVSLAPYPAFNKAIASFRFFAERALTRPQHREQALRGAFLSAAIACIALDAALEKLVFHDPSSRHHLLYSGVTYGDAGDNRVQSSIETVLTLIGATVRNGRAIARQTHDALTSMFAGLRAEIIAEFFSKEQNAAQLFSVARELEFRAHARARTEMTALSIEAKSIIGVFADFVGAKRTALMSSDFIATVSEPTPPASEAAASSTSARSPRSRAPIDGTNQRTVDAPTGDEAISESDDPDEGKESRLL